MKVKNSTASYWKVTKDNKRAVCDLDELAEIYTENVGNIPEHLGMTKAMEIFLLAQAYLNYRDRDKMKTKRATK